MIEDHRCKLPLPPEGEHGNPPETHWVCPECGHHWDWKWVDQYTFHDPVGGTEFRGFRWVEEPWVPE